MLRDRLAAGRRVLAPLTQVRILVPQPIRRAHHSSWSDEHGELVLSLSKGHFDAKRAALIKLMISIQIFRPVASQIFGTIERLVGFADPIVN